MNKDKAYYIMRQNCS